MRLINRTLIVLLRETYSSLSRRFVYDPSYCSSKETEVPEVVRTLILIITRSRTDEPRLSSDFREFIFLNFLSFVSYLRD